MGVTLPAVIAASRINLRQRKSTQATLEQPVIKTTMPSTIPCFHSNWIKEYLPSLASHIDEPLIQAIYKQLQKICMPTDELATANSHLNQARETLNRNRQKLLSCTDTEKKQLLNEIKKNSDEVLIKYEELKKLHQATESNPQYELNKAYHILIQNLDKYQKETHVIYVKKSNLLNQAAFFGTVILLPALIAIFISATIYPLALIGILPVLSALLATLIIKPLYLADKLHNQHPNNEAELNDCFKYFMQTLDQSIVKTPDSDQTKNPCSQTVKAECSHTATTDNLSCHAVLFQPVHAKKERLATSNECIELKPQQ
jgi:hypothetical protein